MLLMVVTLVGSLFVASLVLLRRLVAKRGTGAVTVVVLGDIGRSPRVQYHALQLSRHFDRVNLVGSSGTAPLPSVASNRAVRVIAMSPIPGLPRSAPRVVFIALYAPLKLAFQVLSMLHALVVRAGPASCIVVQNPPSLPTLPVVWVASLILGCRVVIDWHNLGCSLLALKVGTGSPVVSLAAWVERFFGARRATAHLCVTEAMREFLKSQWGLVGQCHVLRDRPHGDTFKPLGGEERSAFLKRFGESLGKRAGPLMREAADGGKDVGVLVSSTSWTADEDFGVLLDALELYEQRAQSQPQVFKGLLVVITGNGPDRESYERRIAAMHLTKVEVITAWFTHEDYPRMLGSADVGISLHQSSSQLDLPMKVLDMFGAGLPVLARGYPCLEKELVTERTGRTFGDSKQLVAQLAEFFGAETGPQRLQSLREGVLAWCRQMGSWESEWEQQGLPLIASQS